MKGMKYALDNGRIALANYCTGCRGYGEVEAIECSGCDGYGFILTEDGAQVLSLVNEILLKGRQ